MQDLGHAPSNLYTVTESGPGHRSWGRDGGGENSELCGRLMLLSALKRSEDM